MGRIQVQWQARWQTALVLLCALLLAPGFGDRVQAETAAKSVLDEMLPKRGKQPDRTNEAPGAPAGTSPPVAPEGQPTDTPGASPGDSSTPDRSSQNDPAPGASSSVLASTALAGQESSPTALGLELPASRPGKLSGRARNAGPDNEAAREKKSGNPGLFFEHQGQGVSRSPGSDRPADAAETSGNPAPFAGLRPTAGPADTRAMLLAMSRQTLILLYSVIGQAADLYTKGIYARPQAERLFESYAGFIASSREQFETLLAAGGPALSALEYQPFITACDALFAQCAAYRKYLESGDNAHLQEFAKFRTSAWNAVTEAAGLQARPTAQAVSGAPATTGTTAPATGPASSSSGPATSAGASPDNQAGPAAPPPHSSREN